MADLHPWGLSVPEAMALQRKLASRVVIRPLPDSINVLGAADVGYRAGKLVAVMATFRWPDLKPLEEASYHGTATFPYIPGLLSFLEIPAILEAYRFLKARPDVLLCDAHGIAHPRRFGLASHLGLYLGLPSVGCAKTRLFGQHDDPDKERGAYAPLLDDDQLIGVVLRTRKDVRPLYVSPGHLSDVESSRRLVEHCLGKYRIPEPLRTAHRIAARLTREAP